MRTRIILVAGALTAALISSSGHAGPAQAQNGDPSWQPLSKAGQDVLAFRNDVISRMGGPVVSRDARLTLAALDKMAANIRAARASANEGDILGGATGVLLRARIVEAIRQDGSQLDAFLAAGSGDGDEEDAPPPPVINKRYSWSWPWSAPPSVLAVLPELPDALEYRFIGRDLVLVDIDANIIVDVLRDAVPVAIDEEDQ
jgi:hypothetical protein